MRVPDSLHGLVGGDIEVAVELADAFAHTLNAHAGALGLDGAEARGRDAAAVVLNFDDDLFASTAMRIGGRFAAGVTMDVGQRLLN